MHYLETIKASWTIIMSKKTPAHIFMKSNKITCFIADFSFKTNLSDALCLQF